MHSALAFISLRNELIEDLVVIDPCRVDIIFILIAVGLDNFPLLKIEEDLLPVIKQHLHEHIMIVNDIDQFTDIEVIAQFLLSLVK